jgi:hypothetical protein
LVGSNYAARDFLQDTLTADTSNNQFVLTDPHGGQLRFWDFSTNVADNQQGQFQSYTDVAGNVTQVTSETSDNLVAEVQSAVTVGSTTITESYALDYVSSGVNSGMIESVTLRRKVNSGSWSTVRSVDYTYYDGYEDFGSVFDLKTATVKDADGSAIDTSYYRYYEAEESGGYEHGLKFVFTPASYARLTASYSDPTTVDDDDVAPFADDCFEYDGTHRVVTHVVQGDGSSTASEPVTGLGTYPYSYAASSNFATYNSWTKKTVETLPDGHQDLWFTNVSVRPSTGRSLR